MNNQNIIYFQNKLRENRIFEKFGIQKIGVFGSFVKDENYNNVDLLIDENISSIND